VSAPRDPSDQTIDWRELRASVRRRVHFHLQGWSAEEIEDATQDVVVKVLLFVERSGEPESLDGLLTVIARRTAASRIRDRSRRRPHVPVREESAVTADEAARRELAQLEEQVQWRALQVIAYFRRSQAPCLELARARAEGVELKELAARTNQSYGAVLQRWSRCMRRLRDAIARGEVQWDGSGVDE
jgi:DNA-directed RNA polymerase specialized sigma24 family protein